MSRRKQINIDGVVQGVGFRPFIYRLAKAHTLSGFVSNTPEGVLVEVEGKESDLNAFIQQVRHSPPIRSQITELHIFDIPIHQDSEFKILQSPTSLHRSTLISPDIATCDECVKELTDPSNRRFQYPFINCTDCGPRYTIIQDVPYDRPKTTMKSFTMCPECQKEYEDPTNRRFHAQPNACSICGPRVWLADSSGEEIPDVHPIPQAIQFLKQGKILAIKGLGGFHLTCDASNDHVVQLLRQRKHREEKSLAVMVKNIKSLRQIAVVSDLEKTVLLSSERPIVLLRKKPTFSLSEYVAPHNPYIGVMLPYTPLHHLLMDGPLNALIMTSGNLSEEPIAYTNRDASERLNNIADYYLFHDRDIYIRNDDSVISVIDDQMRFIRRSRGYAPMPVFIPDTNRCVLAVGGELKNTISLLKNDRVFLSHHIGDLENAETLTSFEQAVQHLIKILDIEPKLIAHDLHPDYLSSQWALKQSLPKIGIQHHHAHIVSCMSENGYSKPVIGLALDGTGYGTDGNLWGGEVIVSDFKSFERVAHLEYRSMPGGSLVIKEPWRMALSYLYSMQDQDRLEIESWGDHLLTLPAFNKISRDKIFTVIQMIHQNINCPFTSSLGRLFDAVSFITGICENTTFEGQPAMLLEQAMQNPYAKDMIYPNAFEFESHKNPIQINPNHLFQCILEDINDKIPVSKISFRFHCSIVDLFVRLSLIVSEKTGIQTIALSGGCFQNRFLLSRLSNVLIKEGLSVISHHHTPCNDGGLSLGQAVIASNLDIEAIK
ncbi:carbamoyltransferase HypF [bacterium]